MHARPIAGPDSGGLAAARGPQRERLAAPWRGAVAALLCLGASSAAGCRIADAKVANLREVHHPDGRPKRIGVIRNDFQFVLGLVMQELNVNARQFSVGKQKEIEDPLGVCFSNVIELSRCDRDDLRVLLLQAEFFGWLAAQDTYALTRERCVIELGDVGRRLGVKEPAAFASTSTPAGPAEVAGALTELLRAARPVLEGQTSESAPTPPEVTAACEAVRSLELDLDGARRLLDALITLDIGKAYEREALAPLGELRLELARRVVAHALAAALDDEAAFVRSAALAAAAELGDSTSPLVLERGLNDPDPEVVRRTALLVRRHGLPQAGAPGTEADPERWLRLLVERAQSLEGPVSVAACRALAAATGREETLRPEAWLEWWEETRSAPTPGSADEASSPAPPR